MKRNLLFAMMVGAMFVSCSDDVATQGNSLPGENEPVEVQFGKVSVESSVEQSRALINDSGWRGDETLSLLGLAKGSDADWSDPDFVLFNKATNGCVKATIKNGTAQLANTYYYPFDYKKSFSFYACHPYAAVTKTMDKVTVNYTDVKGDVDIIAGSAVCKYEDGYNAKYYRQHINEVADISELHPVLELKHMLTKLDFYVQKGENDEGAHDLNVKSITIKSVPTSFQLTLADKNNAEATLNVASTPANADITVYGKTGDQPITPVANKQLAGAVAVYPSSSCYNVSVVLVDSKTGEIYNDGKTIELNTADKQPFVAGTSYAITLKIYGMRDVRIGAVNVAPWNAGTPIEEEVN